MRSAHLLQLLLLAFLALSLLPAEAAKHHKTDEESESPRSSNKAEDDDDDEGEKKSSSPAFTLPGANSRGMIAQCQCDELDSCRAKTRKTFRTCKEKCVAKLQHPDWDADEGHRCFAWKEHSRSRQCWEALKKQSCSQGDSEKMIPVNQTVQFHHHQHRQQSRHRHPLHRDNDDEEEEGTGSARRNPRKTRIGSGMDDSEVDQEQGSSSAASNKGAHRHHHHHRHSGFSRMIKKTFGESGTEFLTCVRECFRAQRGKHCTRELKCGLKRLPRDDDMREEVEKCRETKRKERKEMCDCLEKAGVKKVDCGSSAGAERDNKLH